MLKFEKLKIGDIVRNTITNWTFPVVNYYVDSKEPKNSYFVISLGDSLIRTVPPSEFDKYEILRQKQLILTMTEKQFADMVKEFEYKNSRGETFNGVTFNLDEEEFYIQCNTNIQSYEIKEVE